MKLITVIISLFFMSNSYAQSNDYKKMLNKYYSDFPTLTIAQTLTHLKKGDALFLDVRKNDEFLVSHIKGAKRMDLDGSNISEIKDVNKDKLIIVYCSVGARSQTFGEILKKKGFTNVKNMYGGLFYWANEKYPMVDLKENKTARIHGYNKDWGKWVKGDVVY